MPQIRRDEMVVGMQAVKTVQSATWRRRGDKVVNRCVNCESETATHEGERFCNHCNCFVPTYKSTEAAEGDLVTMQFIPRINPNGTKNWTPAGGECFGVATRAEADAIKRKHGLVGVLKMSETATGDMRALPRVIPVDDVVTWKAEGVEYEVVD